MLEFRTCDVFTDRPYAGNPLAIVLGADALDAGQMQTIAREFNLSETIFVRRPRDPAHDAEVRIFFPTAEIPFAGHPTIGCAVHLAAEKMGDGDWETEIVLEEQAGRVPVRVWRRDGRTEAEFAAPVLPHPHPGEVSAGLAPALGLDEAEIGHDAHRPGLFAGGPAYLYVPLRDTAALARVRPLEPGWSAATAAANVDSVYLYVPGADGIRARMFSPRAGIPEDPATGSAAAILAAQLLAAGALGPGETRLEIAQGVEMGRPSRLGLRVTVRDGALAAVHVAGAAVPVGEGRLAPPSPAPRG